MYFKKVVSASDSTADPTMIVDDEMQCNANGTYSFNMLGTRQEMVFEPVAELPAEPTTELTTEPTTVPEPGMLWGDVNASGELELTDLVAFTKYLHGKGTLAAPEAGDMDQDGTLDVFDLGLLKRAYLNK